MKKTGTANIADFLKIIKRLLDDESKQMPLTPLSKYGLMMSTDDTLIQGCFNHCNISKAVKTPEGRRELMGILKKFAAMEQFQLLKKSLLWEREDDVHKCT
jgi:hypothetical protein